MQPVRLMLDMADPVWFEPNTTVNAEVDTSEMSVYYKPFGRRICVAKLMHSGRELVLYSANYDSLPWDATFGAVIARLTGGTWQEAVAREFENVGLEFVAKAAVRLSSAG